MSHSSATARRVVRTLAHRVSIDWSRPVFSSSPEVSAKFNKLQTWVAMTDSLAEKYNKAPGPVDFASAKGKVRDKELVETLEAFYKTTVPPAEKHEWPEQEQIATEQSIAFLKELDAMNKELLPVLEKELDFQMSNRTSPDTTVLDLKINYPLIHEEIEDEIERREWFKDTGIGSGGAPQAAGHH